jgi:hypothetical protein
MINNINMNLLQLEWIKKVLKWINYELNKFLKLFVYYNHYLKTILLNSWTVDCGHYFNQVQGLKHKF